MFILEKRPTPSRFWMAATPVLAVILTMDFLALRLARRVRHHGDASGP